MATTREVITGAVRNLRIIDALDDVPQEVSEIALTKLNDMMFAWATKGVDVNHYTLTIDMPFTLDDRHVRGVKAMLALEMASDLGKDVPEATLKAADEGWRALLDEYNMPDDVAVDEALTRIPTTRYLGEF